MVVQRAVERLALFPRAFQLLLPWYLGESYFSVSDNVRRPNDRALDWTSRLGRSQQVGYM